MTDTRTDFNPRSREGSDQIENRFKWQHEISIHAPVKGATIIIRDVLGQYRISIHAPVKGATLTGWTRTKPHRDFNPRSREGSDKDPDAKPGQGKPFQSTLP